MVQRKRGPRAKGLSKSTPPTAREKVESLDLDSVNQVARELLTDLTTPPPPPRRERLVYAAASYAIELACRMREFPIGILMSDGNMHLLPWGPDNLTDPEG